ncbi:BadM/Rrf2 family transcriptional regulator [Pusillimonas sp. T2]|uniref:RrF2 family transcriptional regulator n=1 Tax=Pusillimonas sp. T2 TaxID=1548123 RepID=UPI000B9466C3|nr:Rrf2 family transcriptional regulator [Pusillimonas sp. T2]OXR49821.1 BadM/Rrf2 family transcriptional regulator [Pusillimonas sp. T2]
MRLTRFSDIGLRVLMYLAQQAREQPVTVAEISSQFGVPHNHLVKVVGAMAKQGWIHATRGRHGGVRLAVSPGHLPIGSVLRTLEGDREAIDCEGLACRLATQCFLRNALQEGLNAFYSAMDRYTLADVVGTETGEKIVQMHRSFLKQSAG